MAKIVVEEQPEFQTLPAESILELKIDEVEIRTVNGARGEWQKVEFKFKILGIQAIGDGSPKEAYDSLITGPIWGSVPFRLTDNPENKLRIWAEAILGMELGVGFELDTDHFVNRQVRGITTTYNAKAIDPATNQPFKRHQIETLLPKHGGAAAAPAMATAAAPAPTASKPTDDPWGDNWARTEEPPF